MPPNYLVIGAGGMGEAIAYDLLQDEDTESVNVVDRFSESLERVKANLSDSRLTIGIADAGDVVMMRKLMKPVSVSIGAASYEYNAILAKIAIDTHTHFCDLGGNNTIVGAEFALHAQARDAGVKIIPDCGIAPGAVSTLVRFGIDEMFAQGLGMPDEVCIRVGGLPRHPQGPLKHMKVFSVRGLINEYIEDTEVLENGKRKLIKSLNGIEPIIFHDERFNNGVLELEAAYTSGGSSTLTKTYQGEIQKLDYKTIRYPGHWEKIQVMAQLGLFDNAEVISNGMNITPRDFTEQFIDKIISYKDEDMLLVRVTLIKDNDRLEYDMIDSQDKRTGHTAMQRTTGYSAAIVAKMMATNMITGNGVMTIEQNVPPKEFIAEWKKRGMLLKERHSTGQSL